VRILLWHVHGSYTTALVHGRHEYLVPTEPDRGPDGRGRADTFVWPSNAIEVDRATMRDADVDLVLLQRPHELHGLAQEWLGGRFPGRDVPAVYLEHNTPPSAAGCCRHPAADRDDLRLVHVTHCNALCWDTGTTPTSVVEHGIVDPGLHYTGEQPRLAIVINDPVRRGRAVGADLLPRFRAVAPVDLFGMRSAPLGGREDLTQAQLHDELARRRVYVHTTRWTSLGLSLLEAMHLGMPVVALATSEVPRAVPRGCGFVSTDVDALARACRAYLADPELAAHVGRCARAYAIRCYGLGRFLADWDRVFEEVTA
jgi:glycosyltransferase involved in cell wall biosynthesis